MELTPALSVCERKISIRTLVEGAAQSIALEVALWIMFSPRFGNDKLFLGLFPIVWTSIRFGARGAAVGALALNFGVVAILRIYPPHVGQIRTIGLLMLVVSSVGLLVGASVTEQERISTELSERTSYLDSVLENSPVGMVVLDGAGRMTFVNRAFEHLALCTQEEMAGSRLDVLFPPRPGAICRSSGSRRSWQANRFSTHLNGAEAMVA
jgi:PAS domain-containing protein